MTASSRPPRQFAQAPYYIATLETEYNAVGVINYTILRGCSSFSVQLVSEMLGFKIFQLHTNSAA